MFGMPVRQYPETQNATVTVTTAYFGAAPDVVAGFITAPIEEAVAQAQGIDYLSSSSYSGVSTVTATLKLNYDSNRALSEINTKVQSVLNRLPPQAQQPVLVLKELADKQVPIWRSVRKEFLKNLERAKSIKPLLQRGEDESTSSANN